MPANGNNPALVRFGYGVPRQDLQLFGSLSVGLYFSGYSERFSGTANCLSATEDSPSGFLDHCL